MTSTTELQELGANSYKFKLSTLPVVINWGKMKHSSDTSDTTDKSSATRPLEFGSNTRSTYAAALQSLEARITGNRRFDGGGYASDGFIVDDDDEMLYMEDEDTELAHGEFFVNSGDLEVKKRERTESDDGEDEGPARKRAKLGEDLPPLVPAVESAVQEFESAYKASYSEKRPGKFPTELEPLLVNVARAAMDSHPNKYIESNVLSRIANATGFMPQTLKMKMKDLVKKHPDSSSASVSSTAAAPSVGAPLEPMLASLDATLLELSKHADSSSEIEALRNTEYENFKTQVGEFVEQAGNAVRSPPWNNTIKNTLCCLSRIQDVYMELRTAAGIPKGQTKTAFMAELASLWPTSWEVNGHQLYTLVKRSTKFIKQQSIKAVSETAGTVPAPSTQESTNGKPSNGKPSTSSDFIDISPDSPRRRPAMPTPASTGLVAKNSIGMTFEGTSVHDWSSASRSPTPTTSFSLSNIRPPI